jgi:hypothetical protein
MGNEVWRSREAELIAKYAERLRPDASIAEDENDKEDEESATPLLSRAADEEIDFRYMNGPPPKDLLNYKNMDLEMSLWAKTNTGWMSVGVLLVLAVLCFIATSIVWMVYSPWG